MQTNHNLIQYAVNSIKAYEKTRDGDFLVAARVALAQCSQPMKNKTMNMPSEIHSQKKGKHKRIGGFIHPKRGFKKRLIKAIEESGMSKLDFCSRADIAPSAIYRYMSPSGSNPSILTLKRITKALNITEKSLLG